MSLILLADKAPDTPLEHEEMDGNFLFLKTAAESAITKANQAIAEAASALQLAQAAAVATNVYTAAEVDSKFETIIGTAPANLNTLQEIAEQLADDESVAAGIVTSLADKASLTNDQTLNGKQILGKAIIEKKVAMAANDIDLSTGNLFTKTISGAATLTVSNVPATGGLASFLLDLTNGGAATITWWSNMKWVGGAAPKLTAAGRDTLGFFTHDAGATWTGLVLGKDIK